MPAAPAGVPTRQNADGTTRIGGLRDGQAWIGPRGNVVANPTQQDIIQGRVTLRQPMPTGTGPGTVPVGGTDADRRAARPRIEGESDRAYEVRTAPTREAAVRILEGNSAAGLRNIARTEGVVTSGTKADLIARLMRVMRDRHEDSAAITRMVNADRAPAPTVAPVAPRTNAPATSGSITPTMTGSQLLAARRALRARQQGAAPIVS